MRISYTIHEGEVLHGLRMMSTWYKCIDPVIYTRRDIRMWRSIGSSGCPSSTGLPRM